MVNSAQSIIWLVNSVQNIFWQANSVQSIILLVNSVQSIIWLVNSAQSIIWLVNSVQNIIWLVYSVQNIIWLVNSNFENKTCVFCDYIIFSCVLAQNLIITFLTSLYRNTSIYLVSQNIICLFLINNILIMIILFFITSAMFHLHSPFFCT